MSLYDYFGVANTQELYDMITNDDPRVDDLQNFLTYAKTKVFNYEALFKLVNSEQLFPRENEAYIIGFLTQRSPTYYAKISGDMSKKEVLNIAFKADIKSYAIVDHPNIFSQDQDGVIRDIDCNIGLIRRVYGNTARNCLDRISIYGEEGILPLRMYSHEAEEYDHYIASSRGVTSLVQEGTIGRAPGASFLAIAKEREVDKYLLKLADSLEKQSAKLQDSPKKKQGRSI